MNKRKRKRPFFKHLSFYCILLFSLILVLIVSLCFKPRSSSEARCGIEGHLKKDGRSHKALKFDCGNGHRYACECDSWVIPKGGIYYTGVPMNTFGDYSDARAVYKGGHKFPCGNVPEPGDIFIYGDYEYRFHYRWDDNWIYQKSQDGWGVRVLDESKSSYEDILENINNKNIVSLHNAFKNCQALETVPVIPESVTDMECCFQGCSSITGLKKLPDSIVNINFCFDGCKALTDAPAIPEGITAALNTFRNCENLVIAPEFPKSVVDLTGTFRGCKSLKTVPDLPGCLLNLAYTFEGCEALKVTPEVPMTVSVMVGTFSGCRSLTTPPVIPTGVTDLDYTFSGCILLKSAPKLHIEVTSLRETFRDCQSLTKAPQIPGNVIDMRSTFEGCISLNGFIAIFANPNQFERCFYNTKINEILGSTQFKESFLATRGNI